MRTCDDDIEFPLPDEYRRIWRSEILGRDEERCDIRHSGFVPEHHAIDMMKDNPDATLGGSGQPGGVAKVVEGGYLCSGRWGFASGSHHTRWLCANCSIEENGEKRLDEEGNPVMRMMWFNSDDYVHPNSPVTEDGRPFQVQHPDNHYYASPTRKAIDKILKDQHVEVNHVMEFDNIETVKRAVEIDAGISIVPQGTVMQEVSKQTLAQVELEDAEFYRPLAAIYKRNKVPTDSLSTAGAKFQALRTTGAGDSRSAFTASYRPRCCPSSVPCSVSVSSAAE